MFSDHYHPNFVRVFQNSQLNDQAASIKSSDISQEETEDHMKYAGVTTTPTGYVEKPRVEFTGQHVWMNRLGKLRQSVNTFQPSEGRYLSFHQTSSVQLNSGIELTTSKAQLHGKNGSSAAVRQKVEVDPSQSTTWKAWYEEPISHTIAMARSSLGSWESFGVSFVTGMKKSVSEHHTAAGSHSNVTEALPLSQQLLYHNYCVLPSASSLLEKDSTVVHVEFASGLVVAFYGQVTTDKEEKRSSQGQFVENRVAALVTGVALYNTSSLSYSVRRYNITLCHIGVFIHLDNLYFAKLMLDSCSVTSLILVYKRLIDGHVYVWDLFK